MRQEINSNFEFSPEQLEAVQRVIAAVEKIRDALIEMVQAFFEAARQAVEFLYRSWTHLQLLEWRVPNQIAKFLSRKMPDRLAFDLGFRWVHSKVQALEQSVLQFS